MTERSLRILLVTHNFPRHVHDMAGAFLLALARGQQALGHEVRVLAPHAPGLLLEERLEGVDVVRFRYGPEAEETLAYAGTMHEQALRSWRARWRLIRFIAASRAGLRREMRAWRPDVLHVHWWVPGGFAFWPRFARRVPVVLTSHGTDVFLLDRFPVARPFARAIFRAARQVTVISSPLVSRVEALGIPRDRITVLPMPLTAERFTTAYAGGRDPNRLLFVGRLVERKGAEYALRALSQLRGAGRPVQLTICGDGPERSRLEALARDLGVGEASEFTGSLPHDAVAELYRTSSVLVMPAVTDWKGEQEGFGMVLVEAMASGLPVVSTRSGGIADVIRDGRTGLLVDERDPTALADAIGRVLDDPRMAESLAAAAQEDLNAHFAPETIARSFSDLYHRAIGDAA